MINLPFLCSSRSLRLCVRPLPFLSPNFPMERRRWVGVMDRIGE